MAKKVASLVKLQIKAGEANPSPPVGPALGQAGVNIAPFHLGRGAVGGEAIALIEVDQPVTEDILQQVTCLPNVVQVKPLSFDRSI